MKQQDTLLIIDDQQIVRDSLASVLRSVGYQCFTASSAEKGIELLKEREVGLVLTDLRLEGASGLEVLEFVKKEYPHTLVILLTAYASLDSAIAAFHKGAYDYLIKPCNVDDLKHTVARSLDKRKQGLENARLTMELEKAYFLTIKSLAAAVDAKDKYTRGHSDRVMQYSVGLGRTLQSELPEFTDKQLNSLQYAALVHDIGKIGIQDSILKKEGKLTPKEYSIIKLHPTLGFEILKDISYLDEVKLFVKHHHEWYNGNGYPDGLIGENIPLGAQIIAVSDAFDAMTSERPYRRAMAYQDAVAELRKYSGQQFAPRIVNAFLKTFPDTPTIKSDIQFGMEFPAVTSYPS